MKNELLKFAEFCAWTFVVTGFAITIVVITLVLKSLQVI